MLMDDKDSGRWNEFLNFDKSGMGTVLLNSRTLNEVLIREIPNVNHPNSENFPFPLKYLICNKHIEGTVPCKDESSHFMCDVKKDGICLENKFQTQEFCKDARYQYSWNPGM